MNQEDMQIIGTLALEKDTKRKGVFINTKSAIQYVVKSMMSDYKSDKLFTGYMNSFENDQKFDDEYRSDEERVEKFWDHIYDKLFIYNFKANDGEFERMTKVHLVILLKIQNARLLRNMKMYLYRRTMNVILMQQP